MLSVRIAILIFAVGATISFSLEAYGSGIADSTVVLSPTSLPLEPVGKPFVDVVFGTTLKRVSDTSSYGGFETQIYNQLQAFSSDNVYLLLDSPGGFILRRVDDLSLVTGFDTSGWNDPRWHPTRPHTIVHFDSNEDSILRLQFTDVDRLITTTAYTFPAQYKYIRVSQSFDELSQDGKWLAGMATRNDAVTVIFSLDIQNLNLGAQLTIPDLYAGPCGPDPDWGEVEPDWIGVSPLGNYLVVQWVRNGVTRCSGLETFDIMTGEFIGRVSDHHHHGDLGVDADGVTEFFMTTELSSPKDNNRPAISMRLLPGTSTASPPIYLQVVDWSDEDHISCQGPNGLCLVSWGNSGGVYDWPFENELFLQYTNGLVLRMVHHRSSKCGYWVQPRASISRDGRYMVFASDWGEQTGTDSCGSGNYMGRGDPYILDVMALPGLPEATTGSATAVTATSATLNGTVNPNGSNTTTYFQYGPTPSYGSTTTNTSAGSGTGDVSVNADLTGLTPATTYHYRVAATNSGGTSFGNDRTFTTLISGSCPECSGDSVALQNATFPTGTTCECMGSTSITIGTGVTVQDGATVTFRAPTVTLQPGFHAENGAVVRIKQE